ncbi:hypothetical protein OF83DRAFT_372581 [Amylostereum chailletii]|nr:hypothetical protein OF83DRAFT_372581 [Amylostereum chailletii]
MYVNVDMGQIASAPPPLPPHELEDTPSEAIIALDGVSARDLDALLSVFYPQNYDGGDLSTQSQWTSVLKLTTLWSISSIRSLAIRRLDALMGPFDRLVAARAYNVDHWIEPALTSLCARVAPLELEEIKKMKPEDIAVVARIRERVIRPSSLPGICPDKIDLAIRSMQDPSGATVSMRPDLSKPALKATEERSESSIPPDSSSASAVSSPRSSVCKYIPALESVNQACTSGPKPPQGQATAPTAPRFSSSPNLFDRLKTAASKGSIPAERTFVPHSEASVNGRANLSNTTSRLRHLDPRPTSPTSQFWGSFRQETDTETPMEEECNEYQW